MMTRKHFIELAEVLKDNNTDENLIMAIAHFCNNQNSNFDFNKFRTASLSDTRKCADALQE